MADGQAVVCGRGGGRVPEYGERVHGDALPGGGTRVKNSSERFDNHYYASPLWRAETATP
ncbi:hypothetical protein [Streptomyces sp. NPDC085937]|uniref:hypothetical protein n=1 Tax=Streptomyces sp. NPDC085937 TaxID=3365742 RepID=UPI0037CE4C63